MSFLGKSFLDTDSLHPEQISILFDKAKKLRSKPYLSPKGKTVALIFFEPSTRTRSSFEMAAVRLGCHVLNLDPTRSSVSKGETVLDTVLNIEAMGPDCMVIRHSSGGVPALLSRNLKVPVINAGDGMRGHPTQALLDAFTILEERKRIEGERVLFVGDISHSRVARSNFQLLSKLGATLGICSPSTLIPPHLAAKGFKIFSKLEEALEWATVCMALRMQTERQESFQVPSMKEFSARFGLTPEKLKYLSNEAIILHPGPVNQGIEISQTVMHDPRTKILSQVRNGVFVRAALLSEILGVEV
jgi:aspartate carbamoyltransferase catalytic subunit